MRFTTLSFKTLFLILGAVSAAAVILFFITPTSLNRFLRPQVGPLTNTEVTKELTWQPAANTAPGNYVMTVRATDSAGHITTRDVTVTVDQATPTPSTTPPPDEKPSEGGGGGGGGGADGGGGGSAEESVSQQSVASAVVGKPVRYRPFINHVITGDAVLSSFLKDGSRTVALLAKPGALLIGKTNVAAGNYCLYLTAKEDRVIDKQPVDIGIYLKQSNKWKVWKIVRFPLSDGKYRTRLAGLLKNYKGGAIAFRLIKDGWHPSVPDPDLKDLNLYLADYIFKPVTGVKCPTAL